MGLKIGIMCVSLLVSQLDSKIVLLVAKITWIILEPYFSQIAQLTNLLCIGYTLHVISHLFKRVPKARGE